MAKYVSVARAAHLLGITRAQLQELIRTGELEAFEGQVSMDNLRKNFPALAFNQSPVVERANIIKDSAYGERLQKLINPPSDVLKAKIRRLSVDLNVERTRARDYQEIIEALLEKLTELQLHSDASQRDLIHELNLWLLARFDSSKFE